MEKEKSTLELEPLPVLTELPDDSIEDEQDYGSWDSREFDDYPSDLPLDFSEHPNIAEEIDHLRDHPEGDRELYQED